MGKWFLDFSFWIQGYRTAQTAHCALDRTEAGNTIALLCKPYNTGRFDKACTMRQNQI